MLRHTTTLGVRSQRMKRRVLPRQKDSVQTIYGKIGVKCSGGRCKAEYDDAARAARAQGVPLLDVLRAVDKAME